MTLRFAKTDAALERLEQAIARLEKAMDEPVPEPAPTPEPVAAPKSAETSDMPDLFERAQEDYAKLDQASRQVEARLDAVADRLQTLLES